MPSLSGEQICALKREMNFLLWTDDPPAVPKDAALFHSDEAALEHGKVNMQCVSHAYITAALFRSSPLRMLKGHVYIVDSSVGTLHQVPKHYWISFNDEGFLDLSLHSETGAPAVIGHTCFPPPWQVDFTSDPSELEGLVNCEGQRCTYLCTSHSVLTVEEISEWMRRPFEGAYKKGIVLSLGAIMMHCNEFLKGTAPTLSTFSQEKAWRTLAA